MVPHKIDIEYLLSDESFINFCKKSSEQDILKWESYMLNNPGYAALVNDAKDRFFELFSAIALFDRDEQEARLINKLMFTELAPVVPMQEYEELKKSPLLSFALKFAAVAAVVLVVLFITRSSNEETKKETKKTFVAVNGERKNLQLPDGSIVILNAGSKFYINQDFGISTRDVYLEGEAFFDVKHNKNLSFIVHTVAMDVKAIGTAFNVKAYKDEKATETSLVRGEVEVTIKQDKNRKLILHPNQKVRWCAMEDKIGGRITADVKTGKWSASSGLESQVQNIIKTDEGIVKETAWTENKLIFTDESFADIAILLERWYGVEIEFEDDITSQYHFTGNFEKEELETVLGFLKESRSFKYEVSETDKTLIKISK